MRSATALILTDLDHGRLGHPARLTDQLAGRSILQLTVERVARIASISQMVLVHPQGQNPAELVAGVTVKTYADPHQLRDPQTDQWVSARKFAPTAWRGGLGQATCYDELLPAGPLAQAAQQFHAESVFIVRADWCCFDIALAQAQLERHLEHPEQMKLIFTQAPPGLSGLVIHGQSLQQMAQGGGTIAKTLGYCPQKPAIDPIGKEVNLPISASVRDCNRRFIYDTPRAIDQLCAIADRLGPAFVDADAQTITDASRAVTTPLRLPQNITLELTPRRDATGPITPQHYTLLDRPDLDVAVGRDLIDQIAAEPDACLTFGGLGEPLLHPQWDTFVEHAAQAGVFGLALETDLLVDHSILDRLLELPLDLIIVRLNADGAETYKKVMGVDSFSSVIENLQYLFNQRSQSSKIGVPWIIPRLVKTSQTLGDMESFFERWTSVAGHAILAPAQSGCGCMPEMSPIPMHPPKRIPCRQLGQRMSLLSNAQVALCDQDWHGKGSLGDAKTTKIKDILHETAKVVDAHHQGQYHSLTLCGSCCEWHRP